MEQPLKPGDMLARYRLERPLGAGGMGSVWLAVQEGLGRRVALKVMHSGIALDPSLAARFRQEAEVAASFNHPGIVPVTDFGVDEGRPFLVMDFLEGESLDSVLVREAPLPPARVAFFAIQVLAALEAMHERNIVHRDLKPDNIFVSASSGVPDIARLLDFGIARVVELDGDSKMTTTGQVLGTPAYMSPEQAKGMPVTPSADLYALGVVMYESLTGRAPFNADNYHQLLFKIVEGNPTKLSELCPGVDEDFLRLVERAMAIDTADRFSSATQMREALAPFAAMDVLRASSSFKATPPKPASNTDPLAATMTPQQVTPLAFDATAAPSATDLGASGAAPAAQSLRPEPPRRRWVPIAALIAVGLVAGVGFVALQQPEEDAPIVAADTLTPSPEPFVAPPEPVAPSDEEPVLDQSEPPVTDEGMERAELAEPNDDTVPTADEPNEGSAPPPNRTGAPPSHNSGHSMHATPMSASMSTASASAPDMSTDSTNAADMNAAAIADSASAGRVMRMCQQGEREMFLVRSASDIYVSGGDPSGAGLRREFAARLRAENAAFGSCLRGKYMDRGQDVNVTFGANGDILAVRLRPYCPMPAAVERCVAGIVRSIDFHDLNPTAGVARFTLGNRTL